MHGNLPIIGRSAVIRNLGDKPIQLLTAKSASLQMPQGRDFRLTHYSGDWGSEYQRNQVMVTKARVQIETNRLTDAANHQFQFLRLAVCQKESERVYRICVRSRYAPMG